MNIFFDRKFIPEDAKSLYNLLDQIEQVRKDFNTLLDQLKNQILNKANILIHCTLYDNLDEIQSNLSQINEGNNLQTINEIIEKTQLLSQVKNNQIQFHKGMSYKLLFFSSAKLEIQQMKIHLQQQISSIIKGIQNNYYYETNQKDEKLELKQIWRFDYKQRQKQTYQQISKKKGICETIYILKNISISAFYLGQINQETYNQQNNQIIFRIHEGINLNDFIHEESIDIVPQDLGQINQGCYKINLQNNIKLKGGLIYTFSIQSNCVNGLEYQYQSGDKQEHQFYKFLFEECDKMAQIINLIQRKNESCMPGFEFIEQDVI